MPKKSDIPQPPEHLKAAGQYLWLAVIEDYDLEPSDCTILQAACTQFDRAADARRVIEAEGAITKDRFGQPKPHPAIEIEAAATRLYLAALRQLGLGLPAGAAADAMRLPAPTGKHGRD